MGKGAHKVKYMYYGIIYTILKYNGFFFLGKNKSPINITCNKYCKLFLLNRKTLSNEVYSFDFYASEKNKIWLQTYYSHKEMQFVFDDIQNNLLKITGVNKTESK